MKMIPIKESFIKQNDKNIENKYIKLQAKGDEIYKLTGYRKMYNYLG